jgi:cytochrome P450
MATTALGSGVVTPPALRIHRSMFKALAIYNQDRLGWMEQAASAGPVVRLPFGPVTLIVVSEPEAARSILITDSQRWRRPPATMIPARMAAGDNLFTQTDRKWAEVQPALAPDFRKRALEPRLAEISGFVQDEVEALPLGTTMDLDQVMGRIAMRVASWVLFGQHLSRARADELVASQRVVVDWVGKRIGSFRAFLPLAPGRSASTMRKHRDVLYAFADEVVARRRRENRPQPDVLQALLEARPGGRLLTDEQIRSHVAGLFAAGNETTAATMGWAMVYGARYPHEWAALRNDPSAVQPYINEILRLRPQAWGIPRSPRRLKNFVPVGDTRYQVRLHQGMVINIWGMNRDPSLWPNPDSFNPARQRTLTRPQERASLPFGLGPRGCIGQHLATAEMLAVLPSLARRGDVQIEGNPVIDPTFTLRVRGGLTGRFTAPAPV